VKADLSGRRVTIEERTGKATIVTSPKDRRGNGSGTSK
jgi:hypothetical protein